MPQKLKTIATLCAIPVFIYMVLLMAVPVFMDVQEAKARFAAVTEEHYGLTFNSSGYAKATAFPAPAIYLSEVSLSDEAGDRLLTAPLLKIKLGWLGLFSEQAGSVELVGAGITLSGEQLAGLKASHASQSDHAKLPYRYTLTNAHLEIKAGENGHAYLKDSVILSNLYADASLPFADQAAFIEADFDWHEKRVNAQLAYQPASHSLNGRLSGADIIDVEFDGKLADNAQQWDGQTTIEIANSLALVSWLTGKSVPDAQTANLPSYALTVAAPATLSADHFMIHRSEGVFNQAKTTFSAYLSWENYVNLALELKTEQLQADAFAQHFDRYILPDTVSSDQYIIPVVKQAIPDYFNMTLLVDVDQVSIGEQTYHDLHALAELDAGDLLVHTAGIHMAGDAKLHLDGALKQLPEGRRFSGRAKLEGKQFNEWLATFEPLAVGLPAEDFSNFDFDGNIFIAKEQMRLSEAKLEIGELNFQGGFAAFFDKVPRVEADIRLQDINLDYFRDVWRTRTKGKKPLAWLEHNSRSFDWLRRLPAILDFNITIDEFTFLDTPGNTATTRLYSQPGSLTLNSVDIRMAGNVLTGGVTFNVASETPQLDVVITASRFNTDYFNRDGDEDQPPFFDREHTDARWSEALFDFSILNHINGSIDMSIGTLLHRDESFKNVKWSAVLREKNLDIKKLSFTILGGTFSMNGSLLGGSVPGISATFSLYNADVGSILEKMFGYERISGRASFSGVIGASGIHPKAWLEQGELKLSTAVRGLRVRDFNLQGVLDTARQARSTQDIKRGVEEKLFNGITDLTADGNINIKHGVLKTPGIRVGYKRVLGNVNVEIDLLKWVLNLSSKWQFPELSTTTIPTLSISLQGDIGEEKTRVDTASLESFVAKKIVGQ